MAGARSFPTKDVRIGGPVSRLNGVAPVRHLPNTRTIRYLERESHALQDSAGGRARVAIGVVGRPTSDA